MPTKFELNPFDPNELTQKAFQKALCNLANAYSEPTAFSKNVTIGNSVTLTFSHAGIFTYKIKYQHLDPKDQPRYIAFYNEQSLAAGRNGSISTVHVVFKFPSKNAADDQEMMVPLKIKYPNNLLVKASKLTYKHNFAFLKREQTNGKYFIHMPYDVCKSTTHFMLLMEKAPGIPLSEFIKRLNENPAMITAKAYLLIALNLLKALDHIHQMDIIHGDIKPNNILIDTDYKIRFVDFGLSKNITDKPTEAWGSDLYFPPKDKANTFKTDTYIICLVILELFGQTDRYFIRDVPELIERNKNILTNEILLGTKDFSLNEIDTITTTLKSALRYEPLERLNDLGKLIIIFEDLFNNHTTSFVSLSRIPDKIQIQDIIALQKKGAAVLLADIIEWFSTETLNAVGKENWQRIALYLYMQIKDEADVYFKSTTFDNDIIQTFITKLPDHQNWQDPTLANYVENMLKTDAVTNDIDPNDLPENSTKAYIKDGLRALDSLKHHYGLNNTYYQECLLFLNDILANLNLDNHENLKIKSRQIIMALQSVTEAITELVTHDGIQQRAPELVTQELSHVKNITDLYDARASLIQLYLNMSRYLTRKFEDSVEQNAYELLITFTQFIFKETSISVIIQLIREFEYYLTTLINKTIDLMKLKKLLDYAGYFETINELFKISVELFIRDKQTSKTDTLKTLNTIILIGKAITILFDESRHFSSEAQLIIFQTVASAMIEKRTVVDTKLYGALQRKIGLTLQESPCDLSWLNDVKTSCKKLELQNAIDSLNAHIGACNQGISLSKFIMLLNENPAMISAKSYLQIVINLLQALNNIHLKNIIHCDIQPGNIRIDENFNVKFSYVELSRKIDEGHNKFCGSIFYAPPEYHWRNNSPTTDVFSLCLVILELLGDIHRTYLRNSNELEGDNYNIWVHEILLGTNGFSYEEIRSIKAILTAALAYKYKERLEDLPTLINKFETLLNNHTGSAVKACVFSDNTKPVDIIQNTITVNTNPPVIPNEIQPTTEQLNSLTKYINEIRDISKKQPKASAFNHWVNTKLPQIFANDRNVTDFNHTLDQVKTFWNSIYWFFNTRYEHNVDKIAWDFLVQLTQYIFQHPTLAPINKAIEAYNKEREKIHEQAVCLFKLKKSLYYAGYWDRISTLFEQELKKYLDCSGHDIYRLQYVIHSGRGILELWRYYDTFTNPHQQQVFKVLVEYLMSNIYNSVDMDTYCTLQQKIALLMISTHNFERVLDSVVEACKSGKLEEALKLLSSALPTQVSKSTLFASDSSLNDKADIPHNIAFF